MSHSGTMSSIKFSFPPKHTVLQLSLGTGFILLFVVLPLECEFFHFHVTVELVVYVAVVLQLSTEFTGNFKIYETKLVQIPLMPYLIFFSILRTILCSSLIGLPPPTLLLLQWLYQSHQWPPVSPNQRSPIHALILLGLVTFNSVDHPFFSQTFGLIKYLLNE